MQARSCFARAEANVWRNHLVAFIALSSKKHVPLDNSFDPRKSLS